MTSAVILPGLDGAGSLRTAFASALEPELKPTLVTYPDSGRQDYSALQAYVAPLLANESRFILIGESFSGPLACQLAAARPAGLIGLVLFATFASPPMPLLSPMTGLLQFAPMRAVPKSVLSWSLFGAWSSAHLVASLHDVLQKVSSEVLVERARAAALADVYQKLGLIRVPTMIVTARHDRVVSARASRRLERGIENAIVEAINGPHALLQAVPEACAKLVGAFHRDLDNSS